MFVGPPTEELLRLREILKRYLILLGLTSLVEIISMRIIQGLLDFLPVAAGYLLYKKDVDGLVRGLLQLCALCIMFVFRQVIELAQLFQVPGPEHFFSTTCVMPPGSFIDLNGNKNTEPVEQCYWGTPSGNVALVFALIFELYCARLSWKMYRSQMEARSNQTLFMMELGVTNARHRFGQQMANPNRLAVCSRASWQRRRCCSQRRCWKPGIQHH